MFDLITGKTEHAPRHQTVPVLISIAVHATLIGGLLVATLMFIVPPDPHEMIMAFVAAPPPPPRPPPRPATAPPKVAPKPDRPVPTSGNAAPIEAPAEIVAEPPPLDVGEAAAGEEGGVPGGIAGGVPGGLLPEVPPPPPAPAPPPAPRALIRIGGEVKEPALIHRVDPVYPFVATVRQLQGRVILEAIVDEEGRVESLRVLRSAGVFDEAALDAVRQWRYSPVLLNGRPEKFILTVVVSFELH